jgi:AcrR family transcriptional regulator
MVRKYRMRKRAEQQDETRQRIVEATVALHTSVGPAATTIKGIAQKAGVERLTVYRHFPDDITLFRACQAHGLEKWPPPDPQTWRSIEDPEERLRLGLAELYSYYRNAGDGLVVIARDVPRMPAVLNALPGRGQVIRSMPFVLAVGWRARGRRRWLIEAALRHATSVLTWHSLIREQRLTEAEAVELLVALAIGALKAPLKLVPAARDRRTENSAASGRQWKGRGPRSIRPRGQPSAPAWGPSPRVAG